jgi:hypothetical protein
MGYGLTDRNGAPAPIRKRQSHDGIGIRDPCEIDRRHGLPVPKEWKLRKTGDRLSLFRRHPPVCCISYW